MDKKIDLHEMILNLQTRIKTYSNIFKNYAHDVQIDKLEMVDFMFSFSYDLKRVSEDLQIILNELELKDTGDNND